MIEKGQSVSYERILEDIKNRDHNDSTRELNPLKKAADAVEIDTCLLYTSLWQFQIELAL